jgi:fibronectin type 3 domain-containing protein
MSLNTARSCLDRPSARRGIIFSLLIAAAVLFSGCSGGGSTTIYTAPADVPPISIAAVAGNTFINISWSPISGVSSYRLYRSSTTPVSRAAGNRIRETSSTIYTDNTVSAPTRYYYALSTVTSGVESALSPEVSAVPGETGTISGTVHYEDNEYDASGFTGNTTMKAVRYAKVEIVNAATSSVPYTGTTDSAGAYSIPVSAGSSTVYVRVLSEAAPGSTPVTVKHLNGAKFGVPSINVSLSGSANISIAIPSANPAGGAFNILDVLATGYEFIHHLSGAYPIVPLTAFWEEGNPNGTYYCTGCTPGDGIYVLNSATDTDEYDDDVLYHEFGHFVAANYSRDDSPGGYHALSSNDLDMRLSWSEGWGDFFPAAVKSWLASNVSTQGLLSSAPGMSLSRYVDTVSGGAGVSFDFGNPPSIDAYKFATNETAVAKILWDLQTNFTVQPIWDTLSSFKSIPTASPVSLETFWDSWYSLRSLSTATTELVTVIDIYSARSITYAADIFEIDDLLASASTYTVGFTGQQARTFYAKTYPAADVDVVSFSATSGKTYTITTSNMLNGADTAILVSGPTGTVIVQNDNTNGATYVASQVPSDKFPALCDANNICHENRPDILGSQISFVAPTSGVYYVRIESSSLKPLSAGKYGSYTLTISSP